MTTSGTITFNPTRTQIVYGALRLVGAYASNDQPRAVQVVDAVEALDMMLKSWQTDGFLWLKQFIYVKMVASQVAYTIGPGSADTVTTDSAALVAFTQRPTRVFFPQRRTISTGSEVPMILVSRQEYAALPNKATAGTPVQVYYDPRIATGALYVWPVPNTTTDQVVLTVDRTIEDVGAEDNTFDVPPEYVRAIKWNLALEIAPEYAMAPSERDRIEKMAVFLKQKMDVFNVDEAPTFFQPGR